MAITKQDVLNGLEQDLLIATRAEIRCNEDKEPNQASYWRGKIVALRTAIGLINKMELNNA